MRGRVESLHSEADLKGGTMRGYLIIFLLSMAVGVLIGSCGATRTRYTQLSDPAGLYTGGKIDTFRIQIVEDEFGQPVHLPCDSLPIFLMDTPDSVCLARGYDKAIAYVAELVCTTAVDTHWMYPHPPTPRWLKQVVCWKADPDISAPDTGVGPPE
jgi:hypothetical protein